MGSDYKVTSRSEDYLETAAAACRKARPQDHAYRFDPVDFIENILMINGVESVWTTRWVQPKGKLSLKLFDRTSIWDSPAEVSFDPATLHFDRTLWANAKSGRTQEVFIAAHEIGHILLHDATAQEFSSEKEARISFRKSDDESAEWQAHVFAGHLLLPTHTVRKINDQDSLAFLCNAPDQLVAERLVTVRNIKKGSDYCRDCGNLRAVTRGICVDCERERKRKDAKTTRT
jgi:hypothetical protein